MSSVPIQIVAFGDLKRSVSPSHSLPFAHAHSLFQVVSTHFELTHGQFSGNGYRIIQVEVGDSMQPFKVLMGTDPKEVKQWRDERKKNWPT